jgi:predicted NAD/FAD-binding protein
MDGVSPRLPARPRIAVIGAGITGLGAAWLLRETAHVTLFEAEPRLGGHADTFVVDFCGQAVPVDTGFIVLNDRNYPNLVALFEALAVPTENSDMGFAVSLEAGRLEYGGGSLAQLFGQRRNLLRPSFHGMWRDILRFYREAPGLVNGNDDANLGDVSLGHYLERERYGQAFIQNHILPMGAAIWSASVDGIRDFPVRAFARFFANHGLLQVNNRPQWRTVTGGSREYVRRIEAALPDVRKGLPVLALRRDGTGVLVTTASGTERFDHAVLATHAPQALALLEDPTAQERAVLGAFRTTENRALLHTDASLMPRRKRVWSAWNVMSLAPGDRARALCVTYWMNRLQNLTTPEPLLVTLNPLREPARGTVMKDVTYHHPHYDAAALAAQARLHTIQGVHRLEFCGAWTGWGFHEDGLASAVAAATRLGAAIPWGIREAVRA